MQKLLRKKCPKSEKKMSDSLVSFRFFYENAPYFLDRFFHLGGGDWGKISAEIA